MFLPQNPIIGLVLLLVINFTPAVGQADTQPQPKSESLQAPLGLSLDKWLEKTMPMVEQTVAFQSQNVSQEALNYLKSRLFDKRPFLWARTFTVNLIRNPLWERPF